jgi:hypothetical protein
VSPRQVPVPRITQAARPGGPGRDSWTAPVGPDPGAQPRAAPCRATTRARDLPLCSGPGRCRRRGFACYVWDPVTTAGAARRGSGHAPAGFRDKGAAGPARPSPLSPQAGPFPAVAAAGKACPAPVCAPARPGRSALPARHRPRGAGYPGPRPRARFKPSGVARARNREGAAGPPLGMSNNAYVEPREMTQCSPVVTPMKTG